MEWDTYIRYVYFNTNLTRNLEGKNSFPSKINKIPF